MKRRILSALLAMAMLFGMLPMAVFAETGTETDPGSENETALNLLASYAGEVEANGVIDEVEWDLSGNMTNAESTDTRAFDILWDSSYLYVAAVPGASDTELTITIGDAAVTVTSDGTITGCQSGTAVWSDSAVEVKIPLAATGKLINNYDVVYDAAVTLGGCTWEGTVQVCSDERLQVVSGWSQTMGANDASNTTNLKTHINDDGSLRFTRLYGDGDETDKYDAAIYRVGAANLPHLVDGLEYTSIEFDFRADAMPEYNSIHYLSGNYAARGFSMSVTDGENNAAIGRPDSINVGITNSAGTLYFMVGHGFNLGTTGSVEAISTQKGLKETFHVQMLVDGEGNLAVYVDGQHLRTFEAAVIDNYPLGGSNSTSIPVVRLANYGNPSVDGQKADGSSDVDFTIDNFVIGNTLGTSALDLLTFDTIKGENESAESISADLVLPVSLENYQLGEIGLTWSSDNEKVISATGKVSADAEDAVVTLTAAVTGNETVSKSFELKVPKQTIEAGLTDETITTDGTLAEGAWSVVQTKAFAVSNGATGSFRALWKAYTAYIAVEYTNADTLELTLGDNTWTVPLTESISVGAVTGSAKDGVAELKVDLNGAGIVFEDYNEGRTIQVVLTNSASTATASLEEMPITLIFSSKYSEVTKSVINVSAGGKGGTYSLDNGVYTESSTGGVSYWYMTGIAAMDHTKDVYMEAVIEIPALPEGNGEITSSLAATGVYFWVTDAYETEGGTKGDASTAVIYNAGNGALKLKIYMTDADIDLGKKVGDKFTIGYRWNADNTVVVYIDGKEVGSAANATRYAAGAGNDCVQLRVKSPSSETATVSLYSMTVTSEGVSYITLEDELSAANVLAGVKLTGLTNDDTITLPGTWETKLGTLELDWASSNDYITLTENADGSYTGKITQAMSKVDTYTMLTMTAGGKEYWSTEASVVGLQSGMETTADTLRVPYTAAGVTVDGSTTDEGWSLDINVLKDNAVAGAFGAQWTTQNLYMAVKTNGAALTVEINGKTVDLSGAVSANGITEFAVSLQTLGVVLADYGVEMPVKVTLGDAVWVGTFVLTSTDWFITDGVEPRLKIASKASVSLGSDAATSYQGYEDIGNGWRLFDLYNPTGKNPAKIRTYLLCWGRDGTDEDKAFYAPLNDRTQATYVEFDFKALSMPVYTPGVGTNGATNWSSIFSNYGLTWNVAAASDSEQGGNADSVSMGIYNTEEGLVFCVLGEQTVDIVLGKYLGDQFRLGTRWNVDGSLTVYLDGEEYATVENAETTKNGYGNNSFILNLIRNGTPAASAADSFDIYITNISIGKNRGESLFEALTIEDILGKNLDPYAVTENLVLPATIYDDQLDVTAPISWEISDPALVAADGTVTRPVNGGKLVTLTASWNGHEKTFEVYIKGLNYTSSTRVVFNDLDTANGGAALYDSYYFTLDTTNNSIVYDQGSSKEFNTVILTDGDASNRLNESCLTIWVSDNNSKYTRVESFKILKKDNKIYLYDFSAKGRYVKVHCTQYLGNEADFTGPQEEMLRVGTDVLDGSGFANSKTVTVSNSTSEKKYDDHWTVSADGIVCQLKDKSDVRFYLGSELLYHYFDGTDFVVRIPEIEAGGSVELTVKSGSSDAMDISNKEYTLEVVYGTREARVNGDAGRWVVELPDSRVMSITCGNDGMEEGERWLTYSFSYSNGLTWTEPIEIKETRGWLHNPGGVTYDPNNGRIIVEGYQYAQFVAGDMAASDCKLRFIYTDDLGQTWHRCPDVAFEAGSTKATYVLSYSDPVIVSSYDGTGPNIDMVLNNGVQYDDTGSFCCRVAYTTDAGLTWTLGKDEIRYSPGEGILAYEGGVSEGTILEVKDEDGKGTGELVLYARCQYNNVDVFCISRSFDYGKTWQTEADLSTLYTVNTQPIMHEFGDAQLMFWGGNNVLGGNSYQRMPMNVAISRDGLNTFEGIQDLYARYSLQGMTTATRNQIINQSVCNQGDTVTLVWDNNFENTLTLRVDDFTNWFYRTKGIWDSFEHSSTKAEGWSTTTGGVLVDDYQSKDGRYSMKLNASSSAVRSVPYLQNGKLSFDLYLLDNPNFQVELESAYSSEYGKAAPVGFRYSNGKMTFLGSDTAHTVTVQANDWNNFTFELDLDATVPVAKLYVNDLYVAQAPVDTKIGDYICWFDVTATSVMYLDCFFVEDTDTVVVPEEPAAPAEPQNDLPKPGVNLTLNESTVLNFRFKTELISEDSYFVVTKDGDPVEYTTDTVSGGTTRVRINLNADQMYNVLSAQLFNKDGKPITQCRAISVRGYGDMLLSTPTMDVSQYRTMIRLLDYGTSAQLIGNPAAGNWANNRVTAERRLCLENFFTDVEEMTVPEYSGPFGLNLTLNETTVMNFRINESEVLDGYTFVAYCGDEEVEYRRDTLDGKVRIRVGINADQLCEEITVKMLDAGGKVIAERSASVKLYGRMLLNSASGEAYKRAMVALLDYGACAQLMSGETPAELANSHVTAEERALLDIFEAAEN